MTQPPPAVFFLSDYGTADEFVGVVHAVLHRLAPHVPVIDLSHQVAPFDVAGGAAMLVRCAPSLGTGVVLAVVDPGVGTSRRAVAIRTAAGRAGQAGPTWLVGPDNGLLLPMAAACGGVESALAIDRAIFVPASAPGPGSPGPTFDGRDVFAPAAAHLALGADAGRLGTSIDPATLVAGSGSGAGAGAGSGARRGRTPAGSSVLTSVTSIDRFGNVQLEAGDRDLEDIGVPSGGPIHVTVADGPSVPTSGQSGVTAGAGSGPLQVRRVVAFAELGPGELGLVVDSSGHLALVLDRASAASFLHPVGVGSTVVIAPVSPGQEGG